MEGGVLACILSSHHPTFISKPNETNCEISLHLYAGDLVDWHRMEVVRVGGLTVHSQDPAILVTRYSGVHYVSYLHLT